MASSQLLLKCATRGANRARQVVGQVKEALRLDAEQRAAGVAASFTECVRLNRITSLAQDRMAIRLKRFTLADDVTDAAAWTFAQSAADDAEADANEEDDDDDDAASDSAVVRLDSKSAALVPQKTKWVPESDFENSDDGEDEEDDDEDDADVDMKPVIKAEPAKSTPASKNNVKARRSTSKPVKPEGEYNFSFPNKSPSINPSTRPHFPLQLHRTVKKRTLWSCKRLNKNKPKASFRYHMALNAMHTSQIIASVLFSLNICHIH